MIVITREPEAPVDPVLEYFLSLDTPESYRVELIAGEIVVTPPPLATASTASRGSSSRFS